MKVKKLWKRNAVVAVVVTFICVAAYLNWSYSRNESSGGAETVSVETTATEETGTRTLGEAVAVDSQQAETISSDVQEGDTYFDTARLSREQARDSALSILQETVDDEAATEEARNAAADSISAMAACNLTETEIEGLVMAKGYPNCVAYVSDSSASVVVKTEGEELTDTDVAIITDIVIDETGFQAPQIKVIETEEE